MTDMSKAIEQATTRRAVSTLTASLYGSAVSPEEQEKAKRAIAALTRAGLLAPAPLREEWGRAYRQTDGVLFVDDQDGSFRDRDDVAQLVPPQHPDSPYDLIVKRGVSDWFPAD